MPFPFAYPLAPSPGPNPIDVNVDPSTLNDAEQLGKIGAFIVVILLLVAMWQKAPRVMLVMVILGAVILVSMATKS